MCHLLPLHEPANKSGTQNPHYTDIARCNPPTRSRVNTTTIAKRIISVEIADTDGSNTLEIIWNTSSGTGLCCASASQSEIGKLSNEIIKANNAPAAIPGAIWGSVMRRNTRNGLAPRVREIGRASCRERV